MDANLFIAKLKADGSQNDLTDLVPVQNEYADIFAKLSPKDRAPFAMNVLCTLCRNIDKVPTWTSAVDNTLLLRMSLDCIAVTQRADYEQVKTLACVYHIHKYAIRQNTVLPKLVLELSYISFNDKELQKEYCKTYSNLLGDRLSYIEKIKASKQDISKLYPRLIQDFLKLLEISDIAFCLTLLHFFIKKLHYLFSDSLSGELNNDYKRIFEALSQKSDLKKLKTMSYKDVMEIFVKLNDCLYIILENASIINFQNIPLHMVVQTCITLIGHAPDILHCVQSIYLNGFCSIFTDKPNLPYLETVFTNLASACETSEKLGYTSAMNAMYPYINQFLKVYIEYTVIKSDCDNQKYFSEPIQIACMTLIELLLRKLEKCKQITKCENCAVKTGLHDGMRLSLLLKDVITKDLDQKTLMENILPEYFSIVLRQYEILKELCKIGCANYQKCYKKLQSDIHNIAILLNKSQNYKYSVKLFNFYIQNEFSHFKDIKDLKNISRALFNKSICELDTKQFQMALKDAYLSLVFAYPEGLSSEKNMSLVIDIKAKELKAMGDDDDSNSLQIMTVVDACSGALGGLYGNLKPFFINVNFCELLEHEYRMYATLWPSIGPIAAVCRALLDLPSSGIPANDKQVKECLYKTVVEAPTVVRTIHHAVFAEVVTRLVQQFEGDPPTTVEERIVQATVCFLKAEFDVAEASEKYGWKSVATDTDSEESRGSCTLAQEYEAMRYALRGVELWTDVVSRIEPDKVPAILHAALQIASMQAQQLDAMCSTAHALQLAAACSRAALLVNDQASYHWNEALILRHGGLQQTPSKLNLDTEPGLVHAAAIAMHYNRIGQHGLAARLVQALQVKLLAAYIKNPDENLELALGYLLAAQAQVYGGDCPCILTAVVAAQRQFLTTASTGRSWVESRGRRLAVRAAVIEASCVAAQVSASLGCSQRARSVVSSLRAPPAAPRARLAAMLVTPAGTEEAQIQIDSCMKYTLGIRESANRPEPPEPENLIAQLNPAWPPGPASGLAVMAAGLEAATYFRAKQHETARKYFEVAFKSIPQAETYIKNSLKLYNFDKNVLEVTQRNLVEDLRATELKILIEATFCELSQENFKTADEYVVRIHEILQENKNINCYVKSDVLNLITASAYIRKGNTKKIDDSHLEVEFENLRLSPTKNFGVPKTPEPKPLRPPSPQKQIKAKDEEVPKSKRRVIKLNLDENTDESQAGVPKPEKTEKTDFIFPVPALSKQVIELIPATPIKRPDIIRTQPNDSVLDFATPKPVNKSEFLTPVATPSEQFFTPMSTMKTYTKKPLRQGLVKNLDEFYTPKSELRKPVRSTRSELRVDLLSNKIDKETKESKNKVDNENIDIKTSKDQNKEPKAKFIGEEKEASKSDSKETKKAKAQKSVDKENVKENRPSRSQIPKSKFEENEASKSDIQESKKEKGKRQNSVKENGPPNPKTVDKKITKNTTVLTSESNPKLDKENTKENSGMSLLSVPKPTRDKRGLKRATSPGKLEKETRIPRATRLRQPIRFSPDEDDKK